MSVYCCCVIHVSDLLLLAFKKCRKEERDVDLSKCLRHLCVPVGHKREVASYRDRRQATGS